MNKRTRLLVLLAVIALCFVFLWPSISWYGRTPKEVQQLALGSTENIKNFAELIESENESDDEENEADKSNISYDINDIEEAMGLVMEIENNNMNKNMTSQHA